MPDGSTSYSYSALRYSYSLSKNTCRSLHFQASKAKPSSTRTSTCTSTRKDVSPECPGRA